MQKLVVESSKCYIDIMFENLKTSQTETIKQYSILGIVHN